MGLDPICAKHLQNYVLVIGALRDEIALTLPHLQLYCQREHAIWRYIVLS